MASFAKGLSRPLAGPLAFPLAPGKGVGVSSLNSLFANGEDGFLLYPMSDLTRLFLLSTGATGNAAVDPDPVGLDLDNHSWGNGVSLATILGAASELVPNPTASGALAGNPGTVPTGWDSFTTFNVNRTAVALTSGGVDISAAGTANTTGGAEYPLMPIGASGAAVSPGKAYRVSIFLGLLSGAFGGSGATLRVKWYQANGTASAVLAQTDYLIGAPAASATQYSFYAVAPSDAAFAAVVLRAAYTNTNAYSWQLRIVGPSCKLVPGNHALQATTTKRPLYKANSGKLYLSFDGTDDGLLSPAPLAAGNTLAVAFNSATASGSIIGGGLAASNHRCRIELTASGFIQGRWGSDIITGAGDIRNTDHVAILTGDSAALSLYLDGAAVSAVPATTPNGGTGGIALGGNADAGTIAAFSSCRVYAALNLNRAITASEAALITSQFRSSYQ